jgi:hypothetical protein
LHGIPNGRRLKGEGSGQNNREVWERHTSTGWKIVPGSESAGPNSLEISKDGKWLYIGGWGSQSFIRLSRGQTPIKKDSVPVGFRLDNLRWAPDGALLAAGQGGTAPLQTSNTVKISPATLKFQELVRHPNIDGSASLLSPFRSPRNCGSVRYAVIASRSFRSPDHRHRNIMTGQHRIHLEETC